MRKTIFFAMFLICSCILYNSAYAQLSNTYTIVNKSGVVVKSVYVSPTGTNNWGGNICTVDMLKTNEGFQYGFDADKDHCSFDIKFTGDDGKDYLMSGVSLCTSSVIILRRLK
jgi:hypothetical protein